MIAEKPQPQTKNTDAVPAILRFSADQNEVLRSASIRALGVQGQGDVSARTALLAALVDEDPDVRSDAMEALVSHVQPEDAHTLRMSLEGDPVREVKLAAIRALALLKDTDSIPLLRDLMMSRCEDRVTWEDELGDWEEWLDIQIACIHALGDMGASEVIDDMFTALNDEFGQSLDIPVFSAFAKMGHDGVPWLLAQVELGENLQRKRAAQALVQADPQALLDYADAIEKSADPQLKLLLVSVLPDTDARLLALFKDNSALVRSAVLSRIAKEHPELVTAALADPEEQVQATALDHLALPVAPEMHDTLVANAIAWLANARSVLATSAAVVLPRLAPDQSTEPLLQAILNEDRPLEVRVAAVKALSQVDHADTQLLLTGLLSNPAQQVRVTALHGLRTLAEGGDAAAVSVLAQTIRGTILPPEAQVQSREDEDGSDVSTPKGDGQGAIGRHVRISRDGDIIAQDTAEIELPATPTSTLESIQMISPLEPEEAQPMAGDTPEESAPKRRKRRAVEGPEAVGDDLTRVALTIAVDLPSTEIEGAILARLVDEDLTLRAAAWRQLALRDLSEEGRTEALVAAESAVQDSDPAIRLAAIQIVELHQMGSSLQEIALADPDALIRAEGVRMLEPEAAIAYVTDPAAAVRHVALSNVLESTNEAFAVACVDKLLTSERIDTLSAAIGRSMAARERASVALQDENLAPRVALVLLEAFAHGQRA